MNRPQQYLTDLNFAFLGYLEARKENWSVFTDVVTKSLSNQAATVDPVDFRLGPTSIDRSFNTGTNTSIQTTIATLAASYTMAHLDMSALNLFLGAQLVSASLGVNWSLAGGKGLLRRSGSTSAGATLVNGVVAIKGNLQLGTSYWFIPYYLPPDLCPTTGGAATG